MVCLENYIGSLDREKAQDILLRAIRLHLLEINNRSNYQ